MLFNLPVSPVAPLSIGFGDFVLENLEDIDVTLTGGFGCQIASFGLGFFIDTLAGFFADAFEDQAIDGLCKA
jgi:hypothetical protein